MNLAAISSSAAFEKITDEDLADILASDQIEIVSQDKSDGVFVTLIKHAKYGPRLVIEPSVGLRTLFNPKATLVVSC